jgi:hypothetical protein
MMYRVVCNEALNHQQWAVVREAPAGRPILSRGPFADERIAAMLCEAMNDERQRAKRRHKPERVIQ